MIYVALLHSIVLGGGRRVIMADLCAMAEELGFRNCRTLVSTGNLVFEAAESLAGDLERVLETTFEQRFGRHVDIIVRSGTDWSTLAAENPFPDGNGADVCVRVMRAPLGKSAVELLEKYREREKIAIINGDLWVDFGGKPSESRILSAMTTKKLGIGTFRNANTVNGIAEMLR